MHIVCTIMETLIIYVYLESEETRDNLNFFIKNGIIKEDKYKYVFLINNNVCSLHPFTGVYDNVEVIFRKENSGDIYTYNWFIEKMGNDYFNKFSNIYFINSSCIGPFIPAYSSLNWVETCNEMLKNYELIGPVCEVPPDNLGFKCLGLNITKNIPFYP
jgi:lipopolysaccharide biosynthesis protein